MIDFSKKIKNSDKFRTPALTYLASGSYCAYPKGTTEYYNFWDQEVDRCVNGYTAEDGDYITGYNYFYLNYCPIQRLVYTTVMPLSKVLSSSLHLLSHFPSVPQSPLSDSLS